MNSNYARTMAWFGSPPDEDGFVISGSGLSIVQTRVARDSVREYKFLPMPGRHMVRVPLIGSIQAQVKLEEVAYSGEYRHGMFSMLRAGETADCVIRDAHGDSLYFYLPSEWFDPAGNDLKTSTGSIELIDRGNTRNLKVASLAARTSRSLLEDNTASRLEMEAAAFDLAAILIRDHSSHPDRRRVVRTGGMAPKQFRIICEAMVASLNAGETERGLVELAELVSLTPNHLCAAFRQTAGVPPHRWLTQLRIERAKALLADSNLPIGEIANRVGFLGQSSFSTAFRRISGLTPTAWRRNVL